MNANKHFRWQLVTGYLYSICKQINSTKFFQYSGPKILLTRRIKCLKTKRREKEEGKKENRIGKKKSNPKYTVKSHEKRQSIHSFYHMKRGLNPREEPPQGDWNLRYFI